MATDTRYGFDDPGINAGYRPPDEDDAPEIEQEPIQQYDIPAREDYTPVDTIQEQPMKLLDLKSEALRRDPRKRAVSAKTPKQVSARQRALANLKLPEGYKLLDASSAVTPDVSGTHADHLMQSLRKQQAMPLTTEKSEHARQLKPAQPLETALGPTTKAIKPAADFVEAFGHTFGIGKEEAEARRKQIEEHPIRSVLEAAGGPALEAIKGLYEGGKRVAGELRQGQQALTQTDLPLTERLQAAASHAVSAMPLLGPALDLAAQQAQAQGMNAPDKSYLQNLLIAATTAKTLGTVAGTAAQAAPFAEAGYGALKNALGSRIPTISPEGEVLPPTPGLGGPGGGPSAGPPTVEGAAEFIPPDQLGAPGPIAPAPPRPTPALEAGGPTRVAGQSVPMEEAGLGGGGGTTPETPTETPRSYSTGGALQPQEAAGLATEPTAGTGNIFQELEESLLDRVAAHTETLDQLKRDMADMGIPPEDHADLIQAIQREGVDAFSRGDIKAALEAAHHQLLLERIVQEGRIGAPRDVPPAETPAPLATVPPAEAAAGEAAESPGGYIKKVAKRAGKGKGKKAKAEEAGQGALPFDATPAEQSAPAGALPVAAAAAAPSPTTQPPTTTATQPQKPLWEMTREELDKEYEDAKQRDQADLVALFGEAGAKKYQRLQKQANSTMDHKKADKASAEIEKMESALTPEQQNLLFGIGDTRHTLEDIKSYRDAAHQLDTSSPEALAHSLKYAVSQVGDPGTPVESMTDEQRVRYAQLQEAFRTASQNGWDTNAIIKDAIRQAATRFSDPEDAIFMLERIARSVAPATPAAQPAPPAALPPATSPMVGTEVNNLVAEITNTMSQPQMLEALGVNRFIGDPRASLPLSKLALLVAMKRMAEAPEAPAATEPKPAAKPAPEAPAAKPQPEPAAAAPAPAGPVTLTRVKNLPGLPTWQVPGTNVRMELGSDGYVISDGDNYIGRAAGMDEAKNKIQRHLAGETVPARADREPRSNIALRVTLPGAKEHYEVFNKNADELDRMEQELVAANQEAAKVQAAYSQLSGTAPLSTIQRLNSELGQIGQRRRSIYNRMQQLEQERAALLANDPNVGEIRVDADGNPTLYLSGAAMNLIGNVVSPESIGFMKGVDWTLPEARWVKNRLNVVRPASPFEEKLIPATLRLLDAAMARSRKSGITVVGKMGEGVRSAVDTLREELIHRQQRMRSANGMHDTHLPIRAFMRLFSAMPRQIFDYLNESGYDYDPTKGGTELYVIEASAKIMAGKWRKMGLTKQQAVDFLDQYFREVAQHHGVDAVTEIKHTYGIARDLQREWEKKYGPADAATGQPAPAKPDAGRAIQGLAAGREGTTGQPARPDEGRGRELAPQRAERERTEQGDEDWLRRSAQQFISRSGSPRHEAPAGTRDARAMEIADAYGAMKHAPDDPAVKASYDALKRDLDKQWDYAVESGITLEPWKSPGQPYADSAAMMADVRNNRHLYFFLGGDMPADHPLAEVDPKTGYTYNDKLRAVHDLYGHAVHGWQFGERGEENAWITHSQMFSRQAAPALTTETKGQNSWVNSGPHMRRPDGTLIKKGEPGWLPPTERPFAEQKAGLLPKRFHYRIDAPLSFISPNTLDIPGITEAQRQFKSDIHNRFIGQANALADDLGLNVVIESVLGSWEGGAENSIAVHYPFGTDPKLVEYYEANLGKLAYQYATARFIPKVDGKDTIHHIWVDGAKADAKGIASLLLQNGIANSTITPAEDGYGVTLIDSEDGLRDNIKKVKTELGVRNAGHNRGIAEFPGNYTDRDAAERQFLETIEGIESERESLRGRRRAFESRPDYDFLYRAIREAQGPVAPAEEPPPAAPEAERKPEPLDLESLKAEAEERRPDRFDRERKRPKPESLREEFEARKPDKLRRIMEDLEPGVSIDDVIVNTKNNLTWDEDIKPNLLPDELQGYEKDPDLPRKITDTVNMMPNQDEWDAAVKAGMIGRLWYERSSRAFDALIDTMPDVFKKKDKNKFLNFVSALSPVQTVRLNLMMAINLWERWNRAGRPQDVVWKDQKNYSGVANPNAKLYRLLKGGEEEEQDTRGGQQRLFAEPSRKIKKKARGVDLESRLSNGIRALQGQPLSGPKVSAFAPNLGENVDKSTNDTWMAVFSNVDPNVINQKHIYDAVSVMVRIAAKKNGIPTRQAQAAIWSFIKTLAESSGWGKGRWIPPQDVINQNLLTPELIDLRSQDFADLLRNDYQIRAKIAEIGGDLNVLDRKLGRRVPDKPEPYRGSTEELNQRLLGAANRLEAARGDERIARHLESKSDRPSLFVRGRGGLYAPETVEEEERKPSRYAMEIDPKTKQQYLAEFDRLRQSLMEVALDPKASSAEQAKAFSGLARLRWLKNNLEIKNRLSAEPLEVAP